ncbi:MAG: VOC family protein [Candidatus Deferrimicrobiaceae bacterium]
MPEAAAPKSNGTDRPIGWGHAVLKVRDLLRSELFYTEVIGFGVVGRRTGMTFLSLGGTHHDLALYEAGPRARMPGAGSLGVVHLAFAMEDESALRRFYAFLKGKATILGAVNRVVFRSFYIADPDGYILEFFADAPMGEWSNIPNPFDRELPYNPGGTPLDDEEEESPENSPADPSGEFSPRGGSGRQRGSGEG